MYTKEEAEGRRLKNPFDTITEGIGINRLTQNFLMAKLEGAFRGTDREAVEMSRLVAIVGPICCLSLSLLLQLYYFFGLMVIFIMSPVCFSHIYILLKMTI